MPTTVEREAQRLVDEWNTKHRPGTVVRWTGGHGGVETITAPTVGPAFVTEFGVAALRLGGQPEGAMFTLRACEPTGEPVAAEVHELEAIPAGLSPDQEIRARALGLAVATWGEFDPLDVMEDGDHTDDAAHTAAGTEAARITAEAIVLPLARRYAAWIADGDPAPGQRQHEPERRVREALTAAWPTPFGEDPVFAEQVAAVVVREIGDPAETRNSVPALAAVIAECDRLLDIAKQEIAARTPGNLSTWHAKGIVSAATRIRAVALGVPCDIPELLAAKAGGEPATAQDAATDGEVTA